MESAETIISPSAPENTQLCLYCKEEIRADAVKCKHCGEFLNPQLRQYRVNEQRSQYRVNEQRSKPSPGIAALLSLFIPGAGQMYRGNVGSGFVWLIVTTLGYCMLIVPGLILHICCVCAASQINE